MTEDHDLSRLAARLAELYAVLEDSEVPDMCDAHEAMEDMMLYGELTINTNG